MSWPASTEVSQGLYGDIFRSGWEFDSARDSGVYLPVEVGYEPQLGDGKLPGHYIARLWLRFVEHLQGLFERADVAIGRAGPTHSGNTQFWVLVDQMLLRQGPGDQDGIIALAGFIHNNPDNSAYAEQYFVGALDRGFWPARPLDTAALLFTYNTVSGQLGKVQAQELELGLPLSNGATGVQSHEMILEVNYNIHVYRGLELPAGLPIRVPAERAIKYSQCGSLRVSGACVVLTAAAVVVAAAVMTTSRVMPAHPSSPAHPSWPAKTGHPRSTGAQQYEFKRAT